MTEVSMHKNADRFYIQGQWVAPLGRETVQVVNPATEQPLGGRLAMGGAEDVHAAVAAAKEAFPHYAKLTPSERMSLLDHVIVEFELRLDDIARAITADMGAPRTFSHAQQAMNGLRHFVAAHEVLRKYEFEKPFGHGLVRREPIGVCALITPWNFPISQIALKVAPALAAGCTMVLKPSELAPNAAFILAEILDAAGVPPGVFNLINGHGPLVGAALAAHPDVAMVSITGSTRAGVDVALKAAPGVKRVCQELGGKSANIILADADLPKAVKVSVHGLLRNTGQACSAPSRLLVPRQMHDQLLAELKAEMEKVRVGDPQDVHTEVGPIANKAQWERVQGYIQRGLDEGARLVCGGLGRPEGLPVGYYAKPTLFAGVAPGMAIWREEIFGPVLCVMPYDSEEEAIDLANASDYGLAAYVQGKDDHALEIARRLRAGSVRINGASPGPDMPFGGYKHSGNGREGGVFGLEEFCEVKTVVGVNGER